MLKEYHGVYNKFEIDVSNPTLKEFDTFFSSLLTNNNIEAAKMATTFYEKAIKDNVSISELLPTLKSMSKHDIFQLYNNITNNSTSGMSVKGYQTHSPVNSYENKNIVF